MSSLNDTLRIANSSLMYNQGAMSTLSHNISNASTPGYSRQVVIGQAETSNRQGNGVRLEEVVRKVDRLVKAQLFGQTSNAAYATTRQQYMEGIEVSLGSPGSSKGLTNIVNSFFAELNNLANNSDTTAQRLGVVKQAQFLTDGLNGVHGQLTGLQTEINNQINNEISVINGALERIASYNDQISQIEATKIGGENTNDLRDKRDQDVKLVAERIGININEDKNGRLFINTESGQRLVDTSHTQLSRISGGPSGFEGIGITAINSGGELANTTFTLNTDNLRSGSIKSLVDVRDTEIPAMLEQINEFSEVLINQLNAQHSRGIGTPPPSRLESAELTTPGTDLAAEIGLVPGSTFDISIVDKTTGNAVNTATVTLPGAPISTADLVTAINNDLTAAGFPATVGASFVGGSLVLEDTSGTNGLVLGNDADDFAGKIQSNPLFEGDNAQNISVRDNIINDPNQLAAAVMRADGGVSLNDNQNAIAMAELATAQLNFDAAGPISAQNTSLGGYLSTITSNLAITLNDNNDRVEFQDALLNDLQSRDASVSGVNLDEELANLIIFQNAFQASARIISVVDEMYDSLLSVI